MAVAAQQIVVATHNKGKLAEIRAILEDCLKNASAGEFLSGESFSLLSAGELGVPDPVETGVTFEENALLKAREACKYTGLPALADDSGLIVDVMGSAPGVLSARWAGVHSDDKANVRLILAQLQDLPVEKLGARFVCSAALVLPDSISGESWQSKEYTQSGSMLGHLVHEPRGNQGFGYDPIFVPDEQPERALRSGVALTSAELSSEEKNAISHRGKALHAILPTLASVLFNESHLSQS